MTEDEIVSALINLAEGIAGEGIDGPDDLEDAEPHVAISILVLTTLASAIDAGFLREFGKVVLRFSDEHGLNEDPDRN